MYIEACQYSERITMVMFVYAKEEHDHPKQRGLRLALHQGISLIVEFEQSIRSCMVFRIGHKEALDAECKELGMEQSAILYIKSDGCMQICNQIVT